MSNKPTVILGAGLAGLITACQFGNAEIREASAYNPKPRHQALLRFRDESVSNLTGIPFKKVTVRKAVWDSRNHRLVNGECPIDLANQYSLKVTGGISGRSVFNLDSATRYIAPDNFQQQLEQRFFNRISYNSPVDKAQIEEITKRGEEALISTIPLPAMLATLELEAQAKYLQKADAAPIIVTRYKMAVDCDVYQTVYFPQKSMQTYRASITGNTLIIEGIDFGAENNYFAEGELGTILSTFGLNLNHVDVQSQTRTIQRLGKIVDIPSDVRAALLYDLTSNHGIFSVGRFACWRNILLDDVAKDVVSVSKLVDASDYSRKLNIFGK